MFNYAWGSAERLGKATWYLNLAADAKGQALDGSRNGSRSRANAPWRSSGRRRPKYVVKRGKTPVLSAAAEARQLLDSIESDTLIGLRDRGVDWADGL